MKIEINRELKIKMLQALKNSYWDSEELESFIVCLYKSLPNEELSSKIKELSKKLGVLEPIIIEIIDSREQVEKIKIPYSKV